MQGEEFVFDPVGALLRDIGRARVFHEDTRYEIIRTEACVWYVSVVDIPDDVHPLILERMLQHHPRVQSIVRQQFASDQPVQQLLDEIRLLIESRPVISMFWGGGGSQTKWHMGAFWDFHIQRGLQSGIVLPICK